MKIFYTDITNDLTAGMVEIARDARNVGKKIYYIVPSSLSFEKEREVLEQRRILEQLTEDSEVAIFDVLVTRFKQLPYYFDKMQNFSEKVELSDIGQAMLFRKVLMDLTDEEIPEFASNRSSSGFIDKCVQLRKEMIESGLTAVDLPDNKKNQSLSVIFEKFEEELSQKFIAQDSFETFISGIHSGKYQQQLKNTLFIIAGFTRFSAQEESLLLALENQSAEIVVSTYADRRSVSQTVNVIGVYSDSVKMIERLKDQLSSVEIQALTVNSVNDTVNFTTRQLTELWKEENDFLLEKKSEKIKNSSQFEMWEAENIQTEVEKTAEFIIDSVKNGRRFKDFSVLVGNLENYQLPIQQTFEACHLPFFLSKENLMSHHPLIVFVESLLAIKKKNYQIVDVISLLKTRLYSKVDSSLQQIDSLEYYLRLHNIKGRKSFHRSFDSINFPDLPSDKPENPFYNLSEIEKLRFDFLGKESFLDTFLSKRKQNASAILSAFVTFVEQIDLSSSINNFYVAALNSGDNEEADKQLQVWTLFQETSKEFQSIFENEKLSVTDFLEILVAGFKNAAFRQIPASVDMVQVRDYELVEPRTNKIVISLGLSASNFPKIKKNSTLLSDDEREIINQKNENLKYIETLEVNNTSKNNFTVLSLLNSATEKLILSTPQIVDNHQEEELSSIFQLLIHHLDDPTMKKNIEAKKFIVSKNLRTDDITPSALTKPVIERLYGDILHPSVSSFEEFYRCNYKYFLSNSLHLHEFQTVGMHANIIGNMFHEVFERSLKNHPDSATFDENFTAALQQVYNPYQNLFKQNKMSEWTLQATKEMLQQTSILVKKALSNGFFTRETEKSFLSFPVGDLQLRGKIDRIDLWDDSLGIIDYKSSKHTFDVKHLYDGTDLQLLTYLDVLRKTHPNSLWGALYLHVQQPTFKLTDLDFLGQADEKMMSSMKFTGLLNDTKKELIKTDHLNFINGPRQTNNFYSNDEIGTFIDYTENLYESASKKIKSGKIEINPIAKKSGMEGIDNKKLTVEACQFCQFKSICRFEATRHPNRPRTTLTKEEVIAQLKEEYK